MTTMSIPLVIFFFIVNDDGVLCDHHTENVALNKHCTISSTHNPGDQANWAVNGDTNGYYPDNPPNYIHTLREIMRVVGGGPGSSLSCPKHHYLGSYKQSVTINTTRQSEDIPPQRVGTNATSVDGRQCNETARMPLNGTICTEWCEEILGRLSWLLEIQLPAWIFLLAFVVYSAFAFLLLDYLGWGRWMSRLKEMLWQKTFPNWTFLLVLPVILAFSPAIFPNAFIALVIQFLLMMLVIVAIRMIAVYVRSYQDENRERDVQQGLQGQLEPREFHGLQQSWAWRNYDMLAEIEIRAFRASRINFKLTIFYHNWSFWMQILACVLAISGIACLSFYGLKFEEEESWMVKLFKWAGLPGALLSALVAKGPAFIFPAWSRQAKDHVDAGSSWLSIYRRARNYRLRLRLMGRNFDEEAVSKWYEELVAECCKASMITAIDEKYYQMYLGYAKVREDLEERKRFLQDYLRDTANSYVPVTDLENMARRPLHAHE